MSYVKEYVQVHLTIDEEGLVVPTSIVFHKEKKYDIESVTASIRAAATKVLGSGTRYTVVIKGQEKYLFEEAGRWFVEAVILRLDFLCRWLR